MRFAILADIHLGIGKKYPDVPVDEDIRNLLEGFIREMNGKVKPQFVVVLGDLIEDDDERNDTKSIASLGGLFSTLRCPVHYVAGNHDLKNISEEKLARLFHQRRLFYSFDAGEYHGIVLFSRESGNAILIPDEQMEWLQQDLKKTQKKSIVFVHHGLADQDLAGNMWFAGLPEKCLIANRQDIRDILAASQKVIAVFDGHLHWDKKNLHQHIPYFTIQSLTGREDKEGIPRETYAVITVAGTKVKVEIKGKKRKTFSYQRQAKC